jgi:hypothetical protein
MQIKQVFSAYDEKDETHHGQFKYCPICGAQLVLTRKEGYKDQHAPIVGLYSFVTQFQVSWS